MRPFIISDLLHLPLGVAWVLYCYVVECIRKPDPGSEFEKKTRHIRNLPGWVLVPLMLMAGYGGIVFFEEEKNEIIGHLFFQKHRDGLHLFSLKTLGKHGGTGLARKMHDLWFEWVWEKTAIRRLRLGAGGHEALVHLWQSPSPRKMDTPFNVLQENEVGWVKLIPS
jgi:hypothetical protein